PVAALLLVILTETACASHRVLVPPRLNLAPYGQIGLVTFTAENARGSLHEFATRRFSEYVLAAQTGIEVLELGPADSVLRRTRATASEKVGGLSLVGGEPIFSAKDPNNAYGQLVNRLVYAVTYDLRSTWVKQ